jgi:hypothetical protein
MQGHAVEMKHMRHAKEKRLRSQIARKQKKL